MRKILTVLAIILAAGAVHAGSAKATIGYEGGTRVSLYMAYALDDRFEVGALAGYQFAWKCLDGMECGIVGHYKVMDYGLRLKAGLGFMYGDSMAVPGGMKWISPNVCLSIEKERPEWFILYMRAAGGPYFALDGSESGAYISVSVGIRFFTYWRQP